MKSFYVYCLFISKRLHDGVLQRPNKLFTFAAFFLKGNNDNSRITL